MLDMILKGADGKSGLITMETLSSDVARILPTFKILAILILIASVSGYLRLLLVGFHPVLQGMLLGLVIGTVAGKMLRMGGQRPEKRLWQGLIALGLALLFLSLHYVAMGWALPQTHVGFLVFAWLENQMREVPQWLPSIGIGNMLEAGNRGLWLFWVVIDAILFAGVLMWSFLQALQSPKSGTRGERPWSVYRLVVLVLAFYASALWARSDAIAPNQRLLTTWTDEVWSHHYLHRLYAQMDAIQAPANSRDRIALEDALQQSLSMDREFPEGHLLQSLEQLRKGNIHYAKDELGRAILEAEQMMRRTWLADGNPLHRDLLLTQLYQIRAKIAREHRQFLAAERDLTVAIIVYREFWPEIPERLESGFFPHTQEFLEKAGYAPVLGFAACHYERHLTRLALNDPEQAAEDLSEAKDLGFVLSNSDS